MAPLLYSNPNNAHFLRRHFFLIGDKSLHLEHLAPQAQRGQGMRIASNPEFNGYPSVCPFSREIADSVYELQSGDNPLVTQVAVHDCPQVVRITLASDLKIVPEGLKPNAAPYLVSRLGMSNRLKVIVERVFMQYAGLFHSPYLLNNIEPDPTAIFDLTQELKGWRNSHWR